MEPVCVVGLVYPHAHTQTHTYIPALIHTYIHANMHIYTHANMHTHI